MRIKLIVKASGKLIWHHGVTKRPDEPKELPVATIAQVSSAMQTVLTTLAETADAQLHYTRRPDIAKFSASTLLQTLVWGWLAHPDASLEQLAQSAARVGVSVSPQAIEQRFSFATASLLRTVLSASLDQVLASDPLAIPLLERFAGVFVQDSTTIVLPDALAGQLRGCGGSTSANTAAALKCGLQLDLLHGRYSGLDLVEGRAADQRLPIQQASLPPGALRLADLGFFDLAVFAGLSRAGVFWLSKVHTDLLISDAKHRELPLLRFVQQLGEVSQWQGWVVVGKGRRLPARLLLQRVPQEVADQRRRRLRKAARDQGRQPNVVALALAAWTILLTNIPATLLSLDEALVLAKVRWQIELVFKLWKSHGLVDQWRSDKPARILCEVYAKLLAMLLQQWCFIIGCWAYPDRSLVKAAQVVRDHAVELASARCRLERLAEVLETIQLVLKRSARMNPRRKHPNTYQLLLALTTEQATNAAS
jgi:hypothetical protein